MKRETVLFAKDIERRYGSNYYLATLFFPRPIRRAVFVLYAFVRIPDEIVDNPKKGSDPAMLLREWRDEWQKIYDTGVGQNEILIAAREVFLNYKIPFSLSLEFIDAMIQDLSKNRYENYQELRGYIRGSAEVVGLMLTYVFDYKDKRAFFYAKKLGEAMQFTNFLRDIYEDLTDRDRIYLPQEDLRKFGVTLPMLQKKVVTPEIVALMRFEVDRARVFYREAEPGILLINPRARRAVRLASRYYEGIIDVIEKKNYNIFHSQLRLSIFKKLIIIFYVLIGK